MTSKGYWASCWQIVWSGTRNYKKSKLFATEEAAVLWIEKELGLTENNNDCTDGWWKSLG